MAARASKNNDEIASKFKPIDRGAMASLLRLVFEGGDNIVVE